MEENLNQQSTKIIKIVVVDPEFTGKVPLSQDLADYFDTIRIPEFARDYLQEKWSDKQETYKKEDLLSIAIGQIQLENEALEKANKYLFCDSNLLTIKVYSEIYYGYCESFMDEVVREHEYDLTFLTDIDEPCRKDDFRDNFDEKEEIFEKLRKVLTENKKPFIFLSGNREECLRKGIDSIKQFTKAREKGFSSEDYVQMYHYGVDVEKIQNHLDILKKGVAKIKLVRPATIGDGIIKFSGREILNHASFFDIEKETYKVIKFVPASGAASRMFSFLNEFLNEFRLGKETVNAYINRKKDTSLPVFLIGLDKLPFYKEVLAKTRVIHPEYGKWTIDLRLFYFVEVLLSSEYFDYANKPKGILPFHRYKKNHVTPIEEHLRESVYYVNSENTSHLHFTISETHHKEFESVLNLVKPKVKADTEVSFNIDFSYQDRGTDTIAVTLENIPLRDDKGQLIFRQSGHGALIENLKKLDADIIFIKNIDNIIQNHVRTISKYKKCLAGVLIQLQKKIFSYLRILEEGAATEEIISEIVHYSVQNLNIQIPTEFFKFTIENKIGYLNEKLNRPIRVCGMVKNEGEPGGGPFWVCDMNGQVSLQIVETSQIDINNEEQVQILERATHFNPVDLVCGIKDSKGEVFDLDRFVDLNSGFIVQKNKEGKELKSYELPGLWNGAMSNWITVFVEVPLITFNPVKTVNDLLKPVHQPV